MAKFEKFEEIEAWKKARKLSMNIYLQTRKESFQNDFALTNQIRKSSGSIMDNIAEGFDRGGNKEFIQFLYIAKGSASETKSQLYRALDQSYIQNEEFELLYILLDEITFMLGKLISYLRNSGYKGSKYK